LRLTRSRDGGEEREVGPQAALVARFRALIEERYRSGAPTAAYAQALAVTPARLRHACLRVAGAPPARLLRDRMLMEARRALLYSNMTVAEVGFSLGFDDPAYFSRFFAKGVGAPPRRFRAQRAGKAA
jgi:AraC family transcriptional activator of pobA